MKSSNKRRQQDDFVLVGRITGAHGIRGTLKVHSYAESVALYQVGEGIRVIAPDGSLHAKVVSWVKPHGRGLLMGLETISDRNLAQSLAGSSLYVDKSRLPALEEDTYYWSDLVGLNVVDRSGAFLGLLDAVIPTPGNDVYVVKGDTAGKKGEILIPAIGDVVVRVDLENKTMVVDPPEGL